MSDETQQYYSTVFGDKGSPSGQLLQDGATDTVANHYKHLFQAKKATPEATGSGKNLPNNSESTKEQVKASPTSETHSGDNKSDNSNSQLRLELDIVDLIPDASERQGVVDAAKQVGLSSKQTRQLINLQREQNAEKFELWKQEAEQTLKNEWGESYNQNMTKYHRAVDRLDRELKGDLKPLLEGPSEHDPRVIKFILQLEEMVF